MICTFTRPAHIRSRSFTKVADRFSKGVWPVKSRITKNRQVFGDLRDVVSDQVIRSIKLCLTSHSVPLFLEQLQIDLKHRLEQTHVCAVVESNHCFPHVDDEHF